VALPGAEGWRSGSSILSLCVVSAAPVLMAVWRLSLYADAAMRSVLIRLCLAVVYVLMLLEVGMVLGAVT